MIEPSAAILAALALAAQPRAHASAACYATPSGASAPTPIVVVDPATGEVDVTGSGVVRDGSACGYVVTGASPPVVPSG